MWYRVVLLIHILAGIAWLGGGLAIWVTQQRALRAGGRAALDRPPRPGMGRHLAGHSKPTSGRRHRDSDGAFGSRVASYPNLDLADVAILIAYQGLAFTVGARLYRRLESGDGARTRDDPGISLIRLQHLIAVDESNRQPGDSLLLHQPRDLLAEPGNHRGHCLLRP